MEAYSEENSSTMKLNNKTPMPSALKQEMVTYLSITLMKLNGSPTNLFTKENLIIKPEFRIDSSDGLFGTTANPTDSLASFLIAAIYTFD